MSRRTRIKITQETELNTVSFSTLTLYKTEEGVYGFVEKLRAGHILDIAEGSAKDIEKWVDKYFGILIRFDY